MPVQNIYPGKAVNSNYHADKNKIHFAARIETFMADPLNYGDIVMFGDSITEQGGDWGERFGFPFIKNRGISGDVTEGLLLRVAEIIYYKPKAVYILIGVNDLFNPLLGPFYVRDNIAALIQMIQEATPETAITLQTILPTAGTEMREKIAATNKLLKEINTLPGFEIFDLHPHFADEDDLLLPGFTHDGLHLTEAGYELWTKLLKDKITVQASH
jgi:lysophospholipase L1-like esterase